MDDTAYRHLLREHVGYIPALFVSAEQVAAHNPALVQNPENPHMIPFAGLILHFHEAVFSTPDMVHEFLKAHFTKKVRDFTARHPLTIRAHAITGADVLRQLGRKGLIVDLPVRVQVQRLVRNFPVALEDSTRPHMLHRLWHFYTLTPKHRRLLAQTLDQGTRKPTLIDNVL